MCWIQSITDTLIEAECIRLTNVYSFSTTIKIAITLNQKVRESLCSVASPISPLVLSTDEVLSSR